VLRGLEQVIWSALAMNGRLPQCGCAALATIAAFGLCQLCFNNSASSFIAPSTGRRVATSHGEVKSLPLWLVFASAQPAAAITDANSYDGSLACVAVLTVALTAIVSYQRSHILREPLSIAGVPTAQQRRQMLVPLGAAVVAPASACFAKTKEEEEEKEELKKVFSMTPAEKAKKAIQEKEAVAKKKKEEKEKGEQKKKEQEEKRKQEKEAIVKKENEQREAKAKQAKEDKEATEKKKKGAKEAVENKKRDERETAEKKKKEAEEKKRKEEEEVKKQQSGGSIFDTLGQLVVGGLGVVAVLPKKKKAGDEGAAEEATEEDIAPKGKQVAPKVEEPKKDETKKDEAKQKESKKDEAKKDEAKNDDAKQEEAKKDEANKDESKKTEA